MTPREMEKLAAFRGELANAALRVARNQQDSLEGAHAEIARLRTWLIHLNGSVPQGTPEVTP